MLRPILKGLIAGAVVLPIFTGAYLAYAGTIGSADLIYPSRAKKRPDPLSYGALYEQADFLNRDGLRLSAWYVPAPKPTKKALVLLHGHGSSKAYMFKDYGRWLSETYNVFLFDSPGSGDSQGSQVTLGYREQHDVALAIDALKKRGNEQIALMGVSMGGATAIVSGAQSPDVKAVISDCAFASFNGAIQPRAIARGYPLSEWVSWSVIQMANWRVSGDLTEADPIRWVAKLSPRPLLLIHTEGDKETIFSNAQHLYDAAKGPKEAWWLPNGDHAEAFVQYPVAYQRQVLLFLQKNL